MRIATYQLDYYMFTDLQLADVQLALPAQLCNGTLYV